MRIILIGPDGAGKSTIARKLAKTVDTEIEIIDCSYKEEDKYNRARRLLKETEGKNVIFDRFYFPDELVYSEVKGIKKTATEKQQWQKLNNSLADTDIVFWYIYSDLEVLHRNLCNRGDEYIEPEELHKILEVYEYYITHVIKAPVRRIKGNDKFEYEVLE